MRLGRVQISHSYVVDLDNKEMIQHAEDAFYEDLMSSFKYGDLNSMIEVVEAPDADEGDIPEFLTEEVEDWAE